MSIPLRVLVDALAALKSVRTSRDAMAALPAEVMSPIALAEGALGYYVDALLKKQRVEVKEAA